MRPAVSPPSLRCAPDSGWDRVLFWLLAPAARDAAPSPARLPAARNDFLAALGDIDCGEAAELRARIGRTQSLRELWHARAEVFRVVGLAFSESEAERRVARLNRHFPARAPRSQFSPS
jgi:hypothetical protein